MAERTLEGRPVPRPVELLFGLVFVVLGGGAVLHEVDALRVDALALVAAALLVGGAASLVLLVTAALRGER